MDDVLEGSTKLSLDVENERPDAGRDGRTCLARPKRQSRTGTGETNPAQLPTAGSATITPG